MLPLFLQRPFCLGDFPVKSHSLDAAFGSCVLVALVYLAGAIQNKPRFTYIFMVRNLFKSIKPYYCFSKRIQYNTRK